MPTANPPSLLTLPPDEPPFNIFIYMEAPRHQLPRDVPPPNDDTPPEMSPAAKRDEVRPTTPVADPAAIPLPPSPAPSTPGPTRPPTSTSLHAPGDFSHTHVLSFTSSNAGTSNAGEPSQMAPHGPGESKRGSSSPGPDADEPTAEELPSTSAHSTSRKLPEAPRPASAPPPTREWAGEDAASAEEGCRTQSPPSVSKLATQLSNPGEQTTNLNGLRLKRPSSSFIEKRSIAGRSFASNMSPDDEAMSLRVRSLYDCGGIIMSDSSSQVSSEGDLRRISRITEEGNGSRSHRNSLRNSYPGAGGSRSESRINGSLEELRATADKQAIERPHSMYAGGAEDWEDLEGAEVDRYGFIDSPYIRSSAPAPPNPKIAPKRVATALFLQSEEPRKRTLKHLRLSPSAPEMLRSPTNPKQIREKEDLRARKWREMAIARTKPDGSSETGKGGGVEWDFPVKDPKLIRRTWKGIPDCWRGAAWHAFLTASSKARKIGETDSELIAVYHELLTLPCSDDMQIDLDVPRTISSHVMFRRRYRGGQRLLFRVLHSLALYFPDTGYVQGMASLAATLLCYYDEETAFIMLVRLWQLRGLGQLYETGFGGLMGALEEFETRWMKQTVIQKKLSFLNINATAYGTRWYLTLFNYSIPFAAQLRIWDVFMLLGDPSPESPSFLSSRSSSAPSTNGKLSTICHSSGSGINVPTSASFNGTLDVLHATSAAILDGMKMIILKADFEEAMKNLTSFVPVKDEDMLMKVVKAEWKQRRRRW